MITLKKIRTLKDRTQLRKAALLMYRESEQRRLDDDYLEGLRSIVLSSPVLAQSDKSGLDALFSSYLASRDPLCAKDIYYMLLRLLGEEPAEWDFVTEDGRLDASGRTVLPHSLFLDRIRSPYNIGAIFRSAESSARYSEALRASALSTFTSGRAAGMCTRRAACAPHAVLWT